MPVWISVALWASRLILIFLFALSIWAWSIIINRKKYFKELEAQESLDDLKLIIEKNHLKELKSNLTNKAGFRSAVLREVALASHKEQIDFRFNSFIAIEKRKLEQGLPILGTLGSTTPFIGLLGTIMGIIVSFGQMSQGKADMNQVMYSLAEALILTAVGLFVAIPAVIAFNIFSRKVKTFLQDSESLKDYLLAYYKD